MDMGFTSKKHIIDPGAFPFLLLIIIPIVPFDNDTLLQPQQQCQAATSTTSVERTPTSRAQSVSHLQQSSTTPTTEERIQGGHIFVCATGDGSFGRPFAHVQQKHANETCIPVTNAARKSSQSPHNKRSFSAVEEEVKPCFSSQQQHQICRTATRALMPSAVPKVEVLSYQAPARLSIGTEQYLRTMLPTPHSNERDNECPICMCECVPMLGMGSISSSAAVTASPSVTLVKCGHVYHRECIQEAFKRSPRCPKCRANIIEPQGPCPSGKMIISQALHASCAGYENFGCYHIDYHIASGVQQEYHDLPGKRFQGTRRRAYLPNNKDGSDLLNRLKYAWMHGLTFSVGTSLTTGASNVVVWSSIHHKTARIGGNHMHGFPDPNFFYNCNQELDALGVPA